MGSAKDDLWVSAVHESGHGVALMVHGLAVRLLIVRRAPACSECVAEPHAEWPALSAIVSLSGPLAASLLCGECGSAASMSLADLDLSGLERLCGLARRSLTRRAELLVGENADRIAHLAEALLAAADRGVGLSPSDLSRLCCAPDSPLLPFHFLYAPPATAGAPGRGSAAAAEAARRARRGRVGPIHTVPTGRDLGIQCVTTTSFF